MLRVEPSQQARLVEITRNLADRVDEARANGWLGEVQGLQISLEAARTKLFWIRVSSRCTGETLPLNVPMIASWSPVSS
jgi:hypothetical protein